MGGTPHGFAPKRRWFLDEFPCHAGCMAVTMPTPMQVTPQRDEHVGKHRANGARGRVPAVVHNCTRCEGVRTVPPLQAVIPILLASARASRSTSRPPAVTSSPARPRDSGWQRIDSSLIATARCKTCNVEV